MVLRAGPEPGQGARFFPFSNTTVSHNPPSQQHYEFGHLSLPPVGGDDFVPAGMAHGAWREFHVEGNFLGDEGFLGIEHHIPRDFFAGVSGGAGHHGHEGGGDHSVAGVEWVAVADGSVHFVVLGLVAVVVALVFVAGGPAPFQAVTV